LPSRIVHSGFKGKVAAAAVAFGMFSQVLCIVFPESAQVVSSVALGVETVLGLALASRAAFQYASAVSARPWRPSDGPPPGEDL